MMKWILMILCFIHHLTFAQGVSIDDFTYGANITIDEKSNLYQFVIPEFVYENGANSRLSDLKIFNSAQKSVPFQIKPGKEILQNKSLSFHPIYVREKDSDLIQLQATYDSEGEITSLGAKEDRQSSIPVAYVFSMVKYRGQHAYELELNWDLDKKQWASWGCLFESDDLVSWQSVAGGCEILAQDKNTSAFNRTVPFHQISMKYALLRFEQPEKGFKLTSAMLHLAPPQPPVMAWKELEPTHVKNQQEFYYETEGVMPVSELNIIVSSDNKLMEAEIFSRASTEASWVRQFSGFFYRFLRQHQALSNSARIFNDNAAPYWLVRFKQQLPDGFDMPKLKIAWQPGTIIFAPEGNQPFKLVFGNPGLSDGVTSDRPTFIAENSASYAVMAQLGDIYKMPKIESISTKKDRILSIVLWLLGMVVVGSLLFLWLRSLKRAIAGDINLD